MQLVVVELQYHGKYGLFDGPIDSPVELSIGSVIDVTGPGCGTIYAITTDAGVHTFTGSLLYDDCNTCNGIAPPPAQVCHTIVNSSASSATFNYTFNGTSYVGLVNAGNKASICAVTGTVVIQTGTATVTATTNTCTRIKQCRIPIELCQSYLLSNNSLATGSYTYTGCDGSSNAGFVNAGDSLTVCALQIPSVTGLTISSGVTLC